MHKNRTQIKLQTDFNKTPQIRTVWRSLGVVEGSFKNPPVNNSKTQKRGFGNFLLLLLKKRLTQDGRTAYG
jgi:hypothetical protein